MAHKHHPEEAQIREQEKMIEHMARVLAEQAVKLRIMEIALQKTLSHGEIRQVAAELSPAAVKALARAASGPEGRVVRRLPAAYERLVCRTRPPTATPSVTVLA